MAPGSRKHFIKGFSEGPEWRMWTAYALGLSGLARDDFHACLVFYPCSDKTEGLDAGKGCRQHHFRKAGMEKQKLNDLKRLWQGVWQTRLDTRLGLWHHGVRAEMGLDSRTVLHWVL